MTRRLERVALRLYPLAFSRRYGQEMRTLLDETPARATTVLDLLRGALAAHLHPPAGAVLDPADRVRASTSGVLACWVAFAAAGFGFYKTTEDGPFSAAGYEHPLLGDAHQVIQALAVLASAAVVIGALPLIVAALAHARSQRSLRGAVILPALAVISFAALTGLLILVAHNQHAQHATVAARLAFIAWGIAGLVCGAVCVVASRGALFATPAARARLIMALACSTIVTAAMIAMAVATACYAVALPLDAHRLAAEPNGPFLLMSTGVSLVVQLIVMALAGALAVTATRRGWRVAGQLGAQAPT
jgi:hypothetical protein